MHILSLYLEIKEFLSFLIFRIKNPSDSAFLLVLCHAALVGE